jgi:hypothetical protein
MPAVLDTGAAAHVSAGFPSTNSPQGIALWAPVDSLSRLTTSQSVGGWCVALREPKWPDSLIAGGGKESCWIMETGVLMGWAIVSARDESKGCTRQRLLSSQEKRNVESEQ